MAAHAASDLPLLGWGLICKKLCSPSTQASSSVRNISIKESSWKSGAIAGKYSKANWIRPRSIGSGGAGSFAYASFLPFEFLSFPERARRSFQR